MSNIPKTLKEEIEKIWPQAKKNISKINKNVLRIVKKGEEDLTHLYKETKKKTEKLIYRARREELYYELGKNITPLLTSDQLKNKNILKIYTQIQQLNKKLR